MLNLDDPATWPPLVRLTDILPDPKRNYAGILPISRAAFLRGVEEKHYPAPVRLGNKTIAWRKADLLKLIEHGTPRRKRKAA